MFTDYEQSVLDLAKKGLAKNTHYEFAIPDTPEELEKLANALKTLDAQKQLLVMSPLDGSYGYILVEGYPPCCEAPTDDIL